MGSQVSIDENAENEQQLGDLSFHVYPSEAVEGNIAINSQVGIILPTYCEAANVKKLIEEIESLNMNVSVLVIDDSSPDGTANIVRTLQKTYSNILLLTRPQKTGLGTAITDGIRAFLSLETPPKYVITMDADYSHNPQDIPRLVKMARKGYDLVIGSRYSSGGETKKWSPIRIMLSKLANTFASVIVGARIRDCTSGLRCYSTKLLKKVIGELHSQTYEIQIETIRQSVKKGCYITEMPITFTNRKLGKSKLSLNEIRQFVFYVTKTKFENYFEIPKYFYCGKTEESSEALLNIFHARTNSRLREA